MSSKEKGILGELEAEGNGGTLSVAFATANIVDFVIPRAAAMLRGLGQIVFAVRGICCSRVSQNSRSLSPREAALSNTQRRGGLRDDKINWVVDANSSAFFSAYGFVMAVLLFACCAILPLHAQQDGLRPSTDSATSSQRSQILSQVGIDQHLNQQLPLDLHFRDESGKDVRLGDYFGKRPVVLSLVYYRCPMLCGEVLSGLVTSLNIVNFDPGRDYDIVTVSIDPRETPADAAKMKAVYVRRFTRHSATAAQGWHFLTGTQDQIQQLTKSVGFRYVYDPRINQYAHASGIQVATVDGRLAQYFYGIEYSARDLRLGLIEASKNHIGTVVDQLILYCYHYDPNTGHYGAIVMRVVRLAGIVTVLLVGGFIFTMARRDVRAGRMHTGRTA